MVAEWFVKTDKGEAGPFSAEQMLQFAQAGKLFRNTLVRKGSQGAWRPAGQIKGLFGMPNSGRSQPADPPSHGSTRPQSQSTPEPSSGEAKIEVLATPRMWALGAGIISVGLCISSCLLVTGLKSQQAPVQSEPQPDEAAPIENAVSPSPAVAAVVATQKPVAVPEPAVSPPKPRSLADVIAEVEPSVALITGRTSSGTGFVIKPGIVLTNKHVIQTEFVEDVQIHFPSAGQNLHEAQPMKLVYIDPRRDMAFLQVANTPPPLKLTSDHEFRRGQEISVVGNPGMTDGELLVNAVSRGVVSTEVTIDGNRYFQLGISINPGNSGGPVLGSEGDVIGVVTLKDRKKEGLGFCIPPKEVADAISKMELIGEDAIEKLNEEHTVEVAFFEMTMLSILAAVRMETLITAMDAAIKRGGSANDGVVAVSRETGLKVASEDHVRHLQERITRIARSDRYPEATRQRLADFWGTVQEVLSYAENPRGSFNSYRDKKRELDDDVKRQQQTLRILVGTPFDP